MKKQTEKENDEIEKPVENEDIFEEVSGNPEYQDSEVSAHPEVPVLGS